MPFSIGDTAVSDTTLNTTRALTFCGDPHLVPAETRLLDCLPGLGLGAVALAISGVCPYDRKTHLRSIDVQNTAVKGCYTDVNCRLSRSRQSPSPVTARSATSLPPRLAPTHPHPIAGMYLPSASSMLKAMVACRLNQKRIERVSAWSSGC